MIIEVNGEALELPVNSTVAELIKHLALAPERLAIELNRHVVRRSDWLQTPLNENDRIEIVHFVGGGIRAVKSEK